MSVSDPLTFPVNAMTIEKEDQSGLKPSGPSAGDQNDNVIQSVSESPRRVAEKKEYDFLVWHDACNEKEADRIYRVMEGRDLRGYIFERDKMAGQYKINAMEAAARNTANVILLISRPALESVEFTRKMHSTVTSPQNVVIPIYIGIRKVDGPRLLHHHVEIQYKDDDVFWNRLYYSIMRQKKGGDSVTEALLLSKPEKKAPLPHSSSTPKHRVKPPKMVPEMRHRGVPPQQPSQSSLPGQRSEKGGLFALFRLWKNTPPKQPAIQMEPVRTKCKTPTNGK